MFPGIIIPPENFDNLPNIDEASFFIKCAKMCQKALNSNKFIATHFIIKYLESIGENDRASQIKALLIPETMQLR